MTELTLVDFPEEKECAEEDAEGEANEDMEEVFGGNNLVHGRRSF